LYDAVRKIEIKEERGAVKEKHFFSLSLSLPLLYVDPNKHRSQHEEEEEEEKKRRRSQER